MNYIASIGTGISVILIAIAGFYVIKSWALWRNMNPTGIGVEVAKDRIFLSDNFKLFMALSVLSSLHIVFELENRMEWLSPPPLHSLFETLYYLNTIVIMSIFLILTLMWYKLLLKVNKWDERWIKVE